MDWLKNNGLSIGIAIAGIIATYSINTALYGYRLGTLEDRQDRQGISIQALQTAQALQASQYAELKATLNAVNDNVNYIRTRVDQSFRQ